MVFSSLINLEKLETVSIIGQNGSTVICTSGSGVSLRNCKNSIIEGITWIGCGDFSTFKNQSVLNIYKSNVTINNCSFQNSTGVAIEVTSANEVVNISNCNFMNSNHYKDHGGCIKYIIRYYHKKYKIYPLSISNCNFSYNGVSKSIVYIKLIRDYWSYFPKFPHICMNNLKFYQNIGVSIYLLNTEAYINITNIFHLTGKNLFENNVAINGAGIYLERSTIIFDEDSDVKFINNSVEQKGAAIFTKSYSNIIFEHNSRVEFNSNKATNGTIYSDHNSKVIFAATCQVTFNGNSATLYGAAIYSSHKSCIIFTDNSNVTFTNNVASPNFKDLQVGGNIYSKSYGHVSFEKNSVTTFTNNSADFGAAILSLYTSRVTFKGRSKITFNYNSAHYCGILAFALNSRADFKDNTEVIYMNNTVSGILNRNAYYEFPESAGTMCTFAGANITFSGYSSTTFINNRAIRGGAAVFSESNVIIKEYAKVTIYNNTAVYLSGGVFVCLNNTTIIFKDNSKAVFHNNQAGKNGGVIYSYYMCRIILKDNSTSTFINNTATDDGGAIVSSYNSEITFEGNATVTFDDNKADNGGVFYFNGSTIILTDSSIALFSNNMAKRKGGVGYFLNSKVIFKGYTNVSFNNNTAEQNAGVLYIAHSYISFAANSSLKLTHNTVTLNGGALYFDTNSNVTFFQFSNLKFYYNRASYGGAIFANDHSIITLTENSVLLFVSNTAVQYGGAIFLDITAAMMNNCLDRNCITFFDNIANILGDSLYQNMPQLCDNSCINDKVAGINKKLITTPPNELKFDYPAICIDKDSTLCNYYYIQNIMLGSEFVMPACTFDYYNHSVNNTQFLLQNEMHPNYFISAPKQVLISCDAIKGISIMGNQSLTKSANFSINITLNTDFNPSWRSISVKLIIELSPCHLGFWQYPKSLKCECYNASDIVFCSDTSSTIKRGYWFGSINNKPTVTFCPINYCNFTCCEIFNGYYKLSPVRNNQCRSHRTGIACGSCTIGYTLSFDSPKCVKVGSCTVGVTVLVILLTVVYWIIIVALVFGMMYYKAGIWYLYSITYYYSLVDILLNQNLQASRGLDITVNIISSFSKITPQFLGELCLTTGMSGIDQQFIHYIHPSAIIVILVIITLSAKRSQRISNIIRRGIIHIICMLLLLSYTSMASTSLLLMRSLRFHDIDKVYTYLSPDIEYFHGRHLAYSIVALVCAIFIVIGLPFVLILEPFLNRKINFVKIKPLLDQFQGSYKDKWRCFAGYYMICRLFIIIIVISNSSNEYITSYILITASGMIALIHLIIKPYANNKILNKFDGLILQLVIFITALPLFDRLDSSLVVSIAFVLLTLPLLTFITMTLFLNRYNLKEIIIYFINKYESTGNDYVIITDNEASNETELKEFKTIIVDDSKRKNAIICDV